MVDTGTRVDARVQGSGCTALAGPAGSWGLCVLMALLALARRRAPGLGVLILAFATGQALAVDVQRLHPTDGGSFVAIDEGARPEPWATRFALSTSLAGAPVVLVDREGSAPLVDPLWGLEPALSQAVSDWLELGGALSLGAYLDEDDQLQGPLWSENRIWATVPMTRAGAPTQASWTVQIGKPTRLGAEDPFLASRGSVTGRLALQHARDAFLLGGELGLRLERESELPGLTWGRRVEAGMGLGWWAKDELLITAEAFGSAPVGTGGGRGAWPLELLGSARWELASGLALRAGGGVGVGHGLGNPSWRGLFGLEVGGDASGDRDLDGIVDRRDLCPDRPEDHDRYRDRDGCPDLDNDRDGVVDAQDACPDIPEVRTGYLDTDGGPDSLARLTVGVRSADPRWEGPMDLSLDGARERALPGALPSRTLVPGPHAYTLEADGHEPVSGVLALAEGDDTTLELVLPPAGTASPRDILGPELPELVQGDEPRELVYFDLDSSALRPEAGPVLDELAAWLREHTDVRLLRVDGHADEIGPSAYNHALSVARARAVRERLVALEVEPERLEAIGSGEALARAEGSVLDRQVSFLVIIWERELHPEGAWPEGLQALGTPQPATSNTQVTAR